MLECKECGEIILEVFWEGPFTLDEVADLSSGDDDLSVRRKKYWTLYSAYGSHQLYGSNVLLYIGKTTQGASVRLKQHNGWFDEERFGDTKFFVASLSHFGTWEQSPDMEEAADEKFFVGEESSENLISRAEALLIYSLAPSRNTSGTNSTKKKIGNVRLFNTGNLGSLPNEISGRYWDE